jgi:3-oxoacyl-[acyl-carrier protein] reductase
VKRIAGEIRARFGQIDILVACAGGDIGARGIATPSAGKPDPNDAVFVSTEDVQAVLGRNLFSTIYTCREVAPEMIERKSGKIVTVASVAALSGHQNEAIYATAKAGIVEYTRCLAAQLRPYGINANVVAPGPITTPRFLASRPIDQARMVTGGTLERYGQPSEIATVVDFLVTEASSYMTGQVLRVDGGGQIFPA